MLAAALRAFFLWLSNRRWVARLALATPFLRRMPLRFVAGTTLDQAVAAVRALNAHGESATLDILGESVADRAAADRAASAYVETIERIAAERLDANVSIKLSQMGLDLGVDECLAVMAPRRARRRAGDPVVPPSVSGRRRTAGCRARPNAHLQGRLRRATRSGAPGA